MAWLDWLTSDANRIVALGTFILAVAAVAQFELARRTAQKQLRAYVFPDQSGIYDGTIIDPPQPQKKNVPGVIMLLKNYGDTPARRVVSWANIDVIEPRHENTLVIPVLASKFSNTLGSGGTTTKALWYSRPLNAQEIADIGTGVKAIYFFGRCEYLDVFRRKRFTNFRLYYSGPFPSKGVIFNFSENGNESK